MFGIYRKQLVRYKKHLSICKVGGIRKYRFNDKPMILHENWIKNLLTPFKEDVDTQQFNFKDMYNEGIKCYENMPQDLKKLFIYEPKR